MALGFVPVVGSFISLKDLHCDIQNWEWTFSHTSIATLDAIGIIPEMGGLTRGLKMTVKLEKAGDATRIVGKMTDTRGKVVELIGREVDGERQLHDIIINTKKNIEATEFLLKKSHIDWGHGYKHVGLSDAQILSEGSKRFNNPKYITRALSSFTNAANAKVAVEGAISQNAFEIQLWLESSHPSSRQMFIFKEDESNILGKGVFDHSPTKIRELYNAKVWLIKTPDGGYDVFDYYPS